MVRNGAWDGMGLDGWAACGRWTQHFLCAFRTGEWKREQRAGIFSWNVERSKRKQFWAALAGWQVATFVAAAAVAAAAAAYVEQILLMALGLARSC